MRTIAIGDIHGCSKALKGLIHEINPTEHDRLIFLGDYVDRGPDSKGVIDQLIELRSRFNSVFLLGNHEIVFRSVLGGLPADGWFEIGGSQTLASYGGKLEYVPIEHLEFLYSLRPYFETDRALFIHANYDPNLPLTVQTEQMLYWQHLGEPLPGRHYSGKHVFLGHTPQASGEVGRFGHFTCIDTYCFGSGWLTGIDVENGESWQVSKEGRPRQNRRFIKQLWRKIDSLVRSLQSVPHGSPSRVQNGAKT